MMNTKAVSGHTDKETSGRVPHSTSFMDPEKIVSLLGFDTGDVVADFGCGTGYFDFPVARKIGHEGKVWAFDIRKEKLETVESQAKLAGLTNIETKRANLEAEGGSGLPDASCDWVILANMLFQNKDKSVILKEAKRILKDSGSIIVIEWDNGKKCPVGPDEKLIIPKESMVELFQSIGLKASAKIPVSSFHYGLILKK